MVLHECSCKISVIECGCESGSIFASDKGTDCESNFIICTFCIKLNDHVI